MIPEIIEQMRRELYDTKLCISDFEKYDLKTLEKTNEPFFWLVRTHGTHLCFVGPSVESLFSSESNRFAIMKNSHAIIASIVYWDDLDYNKYSQLYTLMYQSKNELILYYQLQGNNKTDLFCG